MNGHPKASRQEREKVRGPADKTISTGFMDPAIRKPFLRGRYFNRHR
jgi:hypothetical protein